MLVIQRGLLAVYLVITENYLMRDLLTAGQLQIVNWGSAFVAVVAGLLYGNFLGHHWYPLVYDNKGGKVSKPSGSAVAPAQAPPQKTVTVKPVRAVAAKVKLQSETRDQGWDFDDLISHDLPAVESLSNTGPAVATAVSLGEKAPQASKPDKKTAAKSVKAAAKPKAKTAKKPAAKTTAKKTSTPAAKSKSK